MLVVTDTQSICLSMVLAISIGSISKQCFLGALWAQLAGALLVQLVGALLSR